MTVSTKTLTIITVDQRSDSQSQVQLNFNTPATVLDLLNANNISIFQECGGHGTCTTCQFKIRDNNENFSERSDIESERAMERGFLITERLACQTILNGSATIEIKAIQQED